jgi:hypothetical protein
MDTGQSRRAIACRTRERLVLRVAMVPILAAGLGVTWCVPPMSADQRVPVLCHLCTRMIIHGRYVVVPCGPNDLTSTSATSVAEAAQGSASRRSWVDNLARAARRCDAATLP